jgi:hypothetical protein
MENVPVELLGVGVRLAAQVIVGYALRSGPFEHHGPRIVADDDTWAGAQATVLASIDDGLQVTPTV